ncbi:hypothetical protein DCO58_07415 [Helicobacter saguini]|uniref:Uncharacterized protein n=1 Tax=Helicobacter saguini TaxID=1548018 RepID=A0A347VNA7_9HELI|nr:hypothetical protein [Helicobacter saguini]MWV61838.1 hypothetical protein [Helicobacter saguini]MWV67487.1 hypothetical protein [Helicobacter saguini]MWV69838.1 hypothetical protein [Helicobacter saguini]MWV72944.1 hypothetical protein [Helicobacter saguini]TLD95672.1 hypothetical protein LS64_002135 [Helicobacter saguini]
MWILPITESGELEMLKGIDFSKYSFGVITMEHNNVESVKLEIISLLQHNGYRILFQNSFDIMFVRDERISLVGVV